MKSYFLAAKIAAGFMLIMLLFLIGTLHMFVTQVMRAGRHGVSMGQAHHEFVVTVLWIGLLVTILIATLSVGVTAPLRRMSRSMDRIAAGALEHRVPVRGHDEGAAMGRSFNAMAERVSDMIVGQKELMAGVSHELRSPLTRMKLSLELLREGQGGTRRIEDLEAEVDLLDGLVEELLLASRIDLGSVPLELAPLELHAVCREAWTRVAHQAEAAGTTLELRLGDAAGRAMADPALVVRLLGNLFENAVRYGGAGTVTVGSTLRGDRVEISVADEGPGVDEADLERLFEPFFRPDRSRSRKTGAGGLGLMIVRRAAEAHDGKVLARLREPRGLEIVFDLPRAST